MIKLSKSLQKIISATNLATRSKGQQINFRVADAITALRFNNHDEQMFDSKFKQKLSQSVYSASLVTYQPK